MGVIAVVLAAGPAVLRAQPGAITTHAGTGEAGFAGDQGPAPGARINSPRGVAVDAEGHLYLADTANHRIRRVDALSGIITTVAGTGTAGFNGDNIVATAARLNMPRGIAFDQDGHLFIADSRNHRIRRVDAGTGLITTVAGTGPLGFNGDDISATTARIAEPAGLAVAPDGDLVFAELSGGRVRRVDAATTLISTLAGTGGTGYNGDLIPATSALLNTPMGVAVDGDGHVFVADTGNVRLRRVDAVTGLITTVAGTGLFGYNGDGVAAVAAQLMSPAAVAIDPAGHLFLSDLNSHRVRRIDAGTGLISTVAGTGVAGFNGDGQPGTLAQLRAPDPLAVHPAGHLFIGEASGARIRRVEGIAAALNRPPTAGAILTMAGPVCGVPGGTLVQLNGAGSTDPDANDVLTFTWTGPFPEGGGTIQGVSPVVTLPLGGPHVVSLAVQDGNNTEDSTTASITIADTTSPWLTLARSVVSVAPGTGTMTAVDVLAVTGASAVDLCDPNPALVVQGPALFRRGSTTVVTIDATDASGNVVSADAEITVAQGGKPDKPGPPPGKGRQN